MNKIIDNRPISLWGLAYSWLFDGSNSARKATLPSRWKDLRLKKKISVNPATGIAVGQYWSSSDRHQVIIKQWQGELPSIYAQFMTNEVGIYQVLNQIQRRLKTQLKWKFPHLRSPRLLVSQSTSISRRFAIDYHHGKPLTSVDLVTRFNIIKDVTAYLNYLTSQLSATERASIPVRSTWQLAVIGWWALITCLVVRFDQIGAVLAAGWVFIRSLPYWFAPNQMVLTHTDLNPDNLLLDSRKVTIIDWQFACLTIPEYEWLAHLALNWSDVGYRNRVWQFIAKRYGQTPSRQWFIRGLMVKIALHFLTNRKQPEKITTNLWEYLIWATDNPFVVHSATKNNRLIYSISLSIVNMVKNLIIGSLTYEVGSIGATL